MQDKYVGDVGDFGKYGLLKELTNPKEVDGHPKLVLGVNWYLVPNDERDNDGKHITYLTSNKKNEMLFRECDPDLYDKLKYIVQKNMRSVKNVMEREVLPNGTIFYDARLTFDGLSGIGPAACARRLSYRNEWVEKGVNKLSECEIVFLDPDNGLQISSVKKHNKKGPKYVFFDEILPYWKNNHQSLIIYQHMHFSESTPRQVENKLSQLKKLLGFDKKAFGLGYHRGTARVFLVIPHSGEHEKIFRCRIDRLLKGPWGRHFKLWK